MPPLVPAVRPVPPFATGSVPVTPVVSGSPVALVKTATLGVPKSGVVSAGEVPKTKAPVPVSPVTAAARLELDGVPRNVATPVPSPDTPVETGRPVALVRTPAEGVPMSGVTSAGDVAKTNAPVPVSPVTAAARFAVDGVPRKVATPVPRPLTPELTGSPVAFVRVAADGVPRFGVVSAGLVPNTSAPDPVSSVTAVARFALEGVASAVATPVPNPETPVLIGRPVALVKVPLVGVPRIGVTRVGEVARTTEPVPVLAVAASPLIENELPVPAVS